MYFSQNTILHNIHNISNYLKYKFKIKQTYYIKSNILFVQYLFFNHDKNSYLMKNVWMKHRHSGILPAPTAYSSGTSLWFQYWDTPAHILVEHYCIIMLQICGTLPWHIMAQNTCDFSYCSSLSWIQQAT